MFMPTTLNVPTGSPDWEPAQAGQMTLRAHTTLYCRTLSDTLTRARQTGCFHMVAGLFHGQLHRKPRQFVDTNISRAPPDSPA